MGLSFLNKKIWHPGSFANIEKVWIAEQKHKELERKAIEKAKKVKEEKAIEELKKIQVANGLIPASHLNRLDFMYQGPESSSSIITPEEFLLGKSLNDDSNINKKHFTPIFQESYSNPQNEIFTKIHEDRMYFIKKEERKQRKEIEENPYKVKMLLKDIDLREKSKSKKDDKNKESKHRSKHSHHHHHSHHSKSSHHHKNREHDNKYKDRESCKDKKHKRRDSFSINEELNK